MTTITTGCGGAGGALAVAGTEAAGPGDERTRYFPRQLVGAADLTQDQLYFREKARRHNRMLHGWGIVCGARVRAGDQPGHVVVESGYVLGPYGDEIVLPGDVDVDVTARNLDGDAANGFAPADPWCAAVKLVPRADRPVYLAVAYAEYPTRPVAAPAVGCGCGCDETACEYSRIRDSYRIRVLTDLPATYTDPLDPPNVAASVSCGRLAQQPGPITHGPTGQPADGTRQPCPCPTCAPCPTEPWVVLADLTLQGEQVTEIDCAAHRRYVASFRDFFYVCPEPAG